MQRPSDLLQPSGEPITADVSTDAVKKPPGDPPRVRKPPPPGAVVPRSGNGWVLPRKRGEPSSNPSGKGGSYHDTMTLARSAAPDAMKRLIELTQSRDERVAYMAAVAVLERAWGKAQSINPMEGKVKTNFDLSRLSLADLRALMSVMEAARVPEEALTA